MNTIITGRTNPNVRHLIKGVILCEKLNKHMKLKNKFGQDFYTIYFLYLIIKYVRHNKAQQRSGSEIKGGTTSII